MSASSTRPPKKRFDILGVPMDLGAGRRGVDMGPSALRYAHITEVLQSLGHEVKDHGNVEVAVVESLDQERPGLRHLEAIRAACEATARALQAFPPTSFPIVLGGDHSIAMGSVPGASRGERTGLLWVDAHGDFNTPETSPSGNIHGMPLASLCGFGDARLIDIAWEGAKVSPHDVVLLGVRSLDPREREMIRATGVTVYTMSDIDRRGLARIAEEVVERLSPLPRVHLSLDADVLDPEVAPGVGTPVHGGLTYREAHLLMEILYEADIVTSLDLVEVNPILDRHNLTAETMVELTGSLVGKAIL